MTDSQGPALVVMAAGASRRFGRLKQLEPLGPGGETLLEYSVFDAVRAGFRRLVVVLSTPIAAEFRDDVGRHLERHVEVTYVMQDGGSPVPHRPRPKPWGTAHALLSAAPHVSERFGIVNADDFYGARSFELLYQHLPSTPDRATLVAFRLQNTLSPHGSVTRGVCTLDRSGRLQNVEETFELATTGAAVEGRTEDGQPRRLDPHAAVSMNMWGFDHSILQALDEQWRVFVEQFGDSDEAEFFIPDAVTHLIGQHRIEVDVIETPETWFGLTHPTDQPDVVAALAALTAGGRYASPLWSVPPASAAGLQV